MDEINNSQLTNDIIQSLQLTTEEFENKINDIVESKPENIVKLRAVSRPAIVVILDGCKDELSIIKFLLNKPLRESYNKLFRYKPPHERFKLSAESLLRQQQEDYEKIPYTNFNKLQEDICFVCNILIEGSKEILRTGYFTSVLKFIAGVYHQDNDFRQTEIEYKSKLKEIEALNDTLEVERAKFKKELEKCGTLIWNLKRKVESVESYGREQLYYTNSWESSRRYQNDLVLNMKEDKFTDIISSHKTKVELENRCHNEVQNYIEENMEELQNLIQYWMQRYDDDIEALDSEIVKMKMIWEQLSNEHLALHELYEAHRQEIEDWLNYKEEKRLEEELREKQIFCAIKIQAWWRGTMVRRKLGPFKKIKLPSDLKKKKKKKKKKQN